MNVNEWITDGWIDVQRNTKTDRQKSPGMAHGAEHPSLTTNII